MIGRTRRAFGREFAILFAATVVSILYTWPLGSPDVLFTDQRIADQTYDDYVLYWNCWWIDRAVVHLHSSPLFCPEIFVPHGSSLVASPLTLPVALLAIPLLEWLGPLLGSMVAIKLATLLTFPIAIHSLSVLARRLGCRSVLLAFLAGCAFAFAPFRMLHLCRLHYLANAFVPYALAGLVTLWSREQPRRPLRTVLATSAAIVVTGALDLSSLLDVAFATTTLAVLQMLRREAPWRAVLSRTAAVALGSVLLLSPLLVPFLREARENAGMDVVSNLEFHYRPTLVQLTLSPDLNNLAYYLSPSLYQAVVDPDGAVAYGSRPVRRIHESFCPPGALPRVEAAAAAATLLGIVLACAMALLRRPSTWPLLGLAILGAVLSLGPYREWGNGAIRMPAYYLGQWIPGFQAGRYTATHLRSLLLAGVLLGSLGASLVPWRRALLVCGFAVLGTALVGRLARPVKTQPILVEPVYLAMKSDPRPGNVLELPSDSEIARRKCGLGQVVHGRQQLNGPLTRVAPECWSFFDETPLVRGVVSPRQALNPADPALQEEIRRNLEKLSEYQVRFVLLRATIWKLDERRIGWIENYLSLHPGLKLRRLADGNVLVTVEDWVPR